MVTCDGCEAIYLYPVGNNVKVAEENHKNKIQLPEVTTVRTWKEALKALNTETLFGTDFFLTWDKTPEELQAIFTVADALRDLRERNISARIFDSGLGISLFRDNSTRTRFSFVSACNLLGLEVQDFDEGKSQVAHGETVKETANMISFMADVIGIRDDMYIGKGHTYMSDFAKYVDEGYRDGVLEQRPTLVNLQCDIDHPTQSMADMLHLIHEFGGVENLKGKKVAMTWAYSPSYGKPLSVPQGIVGLFTRFGMDVTLAHPEGYEIMGDVEELGCRQAKESGGSFKKTYSMEEAFEGADIVYPKSWAPFAAMEKRTILYGDGDQAGIDALEKELLAQNAGHKDWAATEELMKTTKDGKALYLHCLPADITGVSCAEGEVDASVFDRYRVPLYKEASYKPYIIAAMIFLQKVKEPLAMLELLKKNGVPRLMR
jgi:knotted carbamoyltransferase YgeW